jgi:hypothetical protein
MNWLLVGDFYLLGLSLEVPLLGSLSPLVDRIAKQPPKLFFIPGMRCEDGGHDS